MTHNVPESKQQEDMKAKKKKLKFELILLKLLTLSPTRYN